jgi:23S rRNA pseudouridine2605 synthase
VTAERDRLQKVLAHAGVSSRRQAEQLISSGRVKVNGEVVTQLGTTVSAGDRVAVDGKLISRAEAFEYYLLHKPPGVVTTVRDPQRRPTVLQLLRGVTARVYPVGRLDADSEGLLLLTNDGELAHRLTHPRYGVDKEYLVELDRPASNQELARIRQGIESQGERLNARRVRRQGVDGAHVSVVLAEGKKREVRRMFEAVGSRVLRLQRTRFGPVRLGDLPPGRYRALTKEEIERLRAATSA